MTEQLDIERIKMPLSNSMVYSNVYLLGSGSDYCLVDTGKQERNNFEHLNRELSERDCSWEQIRLVLITHAHLDHSGLALQIHSCNPEVELIGHPDFFQTRVDESSTLDWLKQVGVPKQRRESFMEHYRFPAYYSYLDRLKDRFHAVSESDQIEGENYCFEVRLTPGHSDGHLCFVETRRNIIFTGDHVLPDETPNVGLRPGRSGSPLRDYLTNLRRLRDRSWKRTLPGHGDPITDLDRRLEELLVHHEERLEEVHSAVRDGSTVWEVAEQILWVEKSRAFRLLSKEHKMLALAETWSHMKYLVEQGTLKRDSNRPLRYSRAN